MHPSKTIFAALAIVCGMKNESLFQLTSLLFPSDELGRYMGSFSMNFAVTQPRSPIDENSIRSFLPENFLFRSLPRKRSECIV